MGFLVYSNFFKKSNSIMYKFSTDLIDISGLTFVIKVISSRRYSKEKLIPVG